VLLVAEKALTRGAEVLGGSYDLLGLTALSCQEEWEEPKGRPAAPPENVPDFRERR